MNRFAAVSASLILLGAGCVFGQAAITNFEECAAAGNPVMESYPRQCRAGGKTYVEVITPPPAPPQESSTRYGEPMTLKVGETATFDGGLSVTLTAINDSRCKKDVVCIWAGELAAALSVKAGAGASQELFLGTTTKPMAALLDHNFKLEAITETSATIVITQAE